MSQTVPSRSPRGVDSDDDRGGPVVLITGASRGIGAAVAACLGKAGAAVAINFRSGAEAAREVRDGLGPGASTWQADIADSQQSRSLVEDVVARYGRIDGLVLNAGIWRGGRIDRLEPAAWDAVMSTSLTGSYNVARHVVPHMRQARFGRIVIVSSAVGLVGFAGDSAYAAAKAGQLGLMRSMAKELGPDGITVNAVAPGFIETDMTREVSDKGRDRMLGRTPLGRPGSVEEVATAVRYLLLDGGYVTGHTLAVDGGFSL